MNNISFLLSNYEKGLKLIDKRIRKYITDDSKVAIFPWAFPIEIDAKKLENEFFKKEKDDIINTQIH